MPSAHLTGHLLYNQWQERAERGELIVPDWDELHPEEREAWDLLVEQVVLA